MLTPSAQSIVFNAAGVGLFVFLGGYAVHSFFSEQTVAPCSTRYPAGVQFSFVNSKGAPMSAIELQARAGFNEFGLLKNASVETAPGEAWRHSLVVALAKSDDDEKSGQNGISFAWPIGEMRSARSACLTYYAKLSKDVDLRSPGHLPGLMASGRASHSDHDAPAGFKARLGWSQSGNIGVDVALSKSRGNWLPSLRKTFWRKDAWVRIEQEVLLGPASKKADVVRVWIDGKPDIETAGLALRASDDVEFSGVTGAVGYSRGPSKAANVKVSPFVVQWR
jgi:hypothetical protein